MSLDYVPIQSRSKNNANLREEFIAYNFASLSNSCLPESRNQDGLTFVFRVVRIDRLIIYAVLLVVSE